MSTCSICILKKWLIELATWLFKIFLRCRPLKKIFLKFVIILLLFYAFVFLAMNYCGILVLQPGIEPTLPALGREVLSIGLLWKFQLLEFLLGNYCDPTCKKRVLAPSTC